MLARHVAEALVAAEQLSLQAVQSETVPSGTSQPSVAMPLQSAKPVSQGARAGAGAARGGLVGTPAVQVVPQAPQLSGSVAVSTSQPSAGSPSQSA